MQIFEDSIMGGRGLVIGMNGFKLAKMMPEASIVYMSPASIKNTGQSPSGKAQDFGSCIRRFESDLPRWCGW